MNKGVYRRATKEEEHGLPVSPEREGKLCLSQYQKRNREGNGLIWGDSVCVEGGGGTVMDADLPRSKDKRFNPKGH